MALNVDKLRRYDPAQKLLIELRQDCEEKGVDEDIRKGIEKAIKLLQDRDSYCENVSSEPSDALKTITKESLTHPFEELFNAGKTMWKLSQGMMTGTLEGNFLQSFVSASKATRVLDVGMFLGYSALACAEVLPPDGKVVTCDIDPYLEPVARGLFNNSPHGTKIEIRIGSADDTLTALATDNQQFDIVFIDANKDGYIGYYKAVMENNLLAKGGSVLMDNALWGGTVYTPPEDWEKIKPHGHHIRKCNEFLQSQHDMHRVLLPIRDGVWILRRKEDMK